MRAGNLRSRFDVIVLPDASYTSMLSGLAPGTMPEAYVGGMTPAGVGHLHTFADAGGTLVALDSATSLPLTAFGLQVSNTTEGQDESAFYIPGTLLRLTVIPRIRWPGACHVTRRRSSSMARRSPSAVPARASRSSMASPPRLRRA